MRDGWYYAEGNKSVGPSTFTALTEHLSKASDPGKVKVWQSGFKNGKPRRMYRKSPISCFDHRLSPRVDLKALRRPLYKPWQRAKPVREQGRTPEVELSSLSS